MRSRLPVIGLFILLAATRIAVPANAERSGEVFDNPPPSYAEAKLYVDSLRFKIAIPILTELVVAEPDNADAWNLLAFSQRQLGDFKSARQNYDKALAIDPDHKGAHENLGRMFLILNDLASAQQELLALTAICPQGCEQRNDLRQAIEAYKARQGS